MSFLKNTIYLAFLILVSSSCASSYKAINPDEIRYSDNYQEQGMSFSYQADVLGSAGNKKLAKKEDKFDIRIVAIKVTNNTGKDINFTKDLDLLIGDRVVQPIAPKEVASKVKQSTGAYLLYMLLTPLKLTVQNDTEIKEYNVGYGIGPGLTVLNMGIAAGANKSFVEELTDYDLYNRTIPDGETVVGLVSLSNYNFNNIGIRLKN